jgi:aryl-alcohol dehydrogenase-like predicted oxidoreductase
MKENIRIPNTDLELYPLACGTVAVGSRLVGNEVDAFFDRYLELGGNVIDTARVYGLPNIGLSEEMLGQWLKREPSKRRNFTLITKGGHPNPETMHTSRMSQADMEADLDASLRALGTDHIDIYFYHRDDLGQTAGDLVERMEGFRKAGKIRYYGCSNWTTKRMKEADDYARLHGYRGFIANEVFYNIGSKGMQAPPDDTLVIMDDEMLAYHEANKDHVAMPYFGLCDGFFFKLAAGNIEAAKKSFYYTPANLEIAKKIDRIREKYHASIAQVLIGFYTAQKSTMLPLAGSASVKNLEDNMEAFNFDFQASDYD